MVTAVATDDFTITVPNFHTAVNNHLSFLKHVDGNLKIHRDKVIINAIRRYEYYWLPLLAENPDVDLEPWLDVHWVWHVHLLAPLFYSKDCKSILGIVPNHRHFDHRGRASEAACKLARELWEVKYPHEPFGIDFEAATSEHFVDSNLHINSNISYDILSAAGRQKSFVYHVSLPHFNDDKFIATAIERYVKFVKLKKKHEAVFLVPMYDVDLVWHTHQLYHHSYVQDTRAYLGKVFPHDDSTVDRGVNSKLTLADTETRRLWHTAYGECFPAAGLMYRGDPPRGKMKLIDHETLNLTEFLCSISVRKVVMKADGADPCRDIMELDLTIIHQVDGQVLVEKIDRGEVRKEGSDIVWCCGQSPLLSTQLSSKSRSNTALFDFVKTKENGDTTSVMSHTVDFVNLENLAADFSFGSDLTLTFLNGVDGTCLISISVEVGKLEHAGVEVKLERGHFCAEPLTPEFEKVWGPIALHRLPDHAQDDWSSATHRLILNGTNENFSCKIIHSASMTMSAVHLVHDGKIVAISHLIGSEQLPHPRQLATPGRWITLDARRGQRAMIIKTTRGDWAVLVGQWISTASNDTESESSGSFQLTVYGLAVRKKQTMTMNLPAVTHQTPSYGSEDVHSTDGFVIRLENISFNLQTGEMRLDGGVEFFAENILLALSAAVLLKYCLPNGAPVQVPLLLKQDF